MNEGDREILEHFSKTREKTKELLGCVADEWLMRTPEGEHHPLSWLFHHAASGELWWMPNVMRDGGPGQHTYDDNKDSILEVMETGRVRVISFFSADDGAAMGRTFSWVDEKGVTEKWIGRNRVLYLSDHEVHHRGKIVLALRQWGLTDLPFMPF